VTTIELRGIVARGRHGVAPEERTDSQEFVLDLDVDVQPDEDELSATVDYREISHCTRRVVDERSFALLETLADEVAKSVKALAGVRAVRVTVHKPGAARSMGVGDVAARAER
jgi:dihydroneopterin aldolase